MHIRAMSLGASLSTLCLLSLANAQTYRLTDLGAGTEARAMNSSRQVTGWSLTSAGTLEAFLYSNGTMAYLGSLGVPGSQGLAINDKGQVVGAATTTNPLGLNGVTEHAFLYSNGKMTPL